LNVTIDVSAEKVFSIYFHVPSCNKMSVDVSDVVSRFDDLEQALKSVFPKVDPRTVFGLVMREKKDKNPLYTLETVLKPGQNTDAIRELIVRETGMAPGFYLSGTKLVVTHKLNLELLKRINDIDYVVSIKASPYSAGASSHF
jgi:hypothetical protein